ncbi:3'-5' exonuclease [Salibacter halophilus]|uniref:3'-5' exonuclease n=1 Tax=Salibacter halophilus TaxID=1803916 RepID=A0A6N6M613_9FLAO|nr:3'-5' exonuclease [Salibacter halophilus]KAB1063702.1 3'-5' exonuclease [Salibacter halophilus]
MLENVDITNILFLDIETVPQEKTFDSLSDSAKALWTKKANRLKTDEETPDELYDRAGIYAEFGKIVCISVGFMRNTTNGKRLRITSFSGDSETDFLQNFADLLNSHFNEPQHLLCAHNGKEFDFPYIARRMLVNGVKLPNLLDIAGKKPWEVRHLDTMELWKFGDWKSYTSLELLAHIFNIPTPKDDIDGSEVRGVYYEENNLDRIVEYCQKDVVTTVQLFLRFKGENLIEEENIDFV